MDRRVSNRVQSGDGAETQYLEIIARPTVNARDALSSLKEVLADLAVHPQLLAIEGLLPDRFDFHLEEGAWTIRASVTRRI